MAETQQQYYTQFNQQQHPTDAQTQSNFHARNHGHFASQVLPLAILVPFGGILFILSGITLAVTVIGLAVATPLFVIFSPVLLPVAVVIGLAVAGFLTSGAFSITGLSSFAWLANYVRRSRWPEQLEHAKRGTEDMVGHVDKRTKEASESVMRKAQELGQTGQTKARESGKAQEVGKTDQSKAGEAEAGKAQELGKTDQSKTREAEADKAKEVGKTDQSKAQKAEAGKTQEVGKTDQSKAREAGKA